MATDVTSFNPAAAGEEPQMALVSLEVAGGNVEWWGLFDSSNALLGFQDTESFELDNDNVDMVFSVEVGVVDDPFYLTQILTDPDTDRLSDPQGDAPSSNGGFRPVFVVLQQGDQPELKDVAGPVAKVLMEKLLERFRPKARIPFRSDDAGQNPMMENLQKEPAKRTRQPVWSLVPKVELNFSPASNDLKDWNSREDIMEQLQLGQSRLIFKLEYGPRK